MHLRAISLTLTAAILLVTGAACGGPAEPVGRENTRAAPPETSQGETSQGETAPAETPAPAPADTPAPPSTPLAASTPVPAPASTTAPESTPTPELAPTPAPLVFGKGATSLHEALVGGGPSVIMAVLMSGGEAVINAGAEIVSPDGSSKCCWTPLHVAVTTSDPDVVSLLVDRGTDIEARTGDGQTPCQLAANRLAGLPAHFRICPTSGSGSGSTPAQTAPAPTEAGPPREFSVDGAILEGGDGAA